MYTYNKTLDIIFKILSVAVIISWTAWAAKADTMSADPKENEVYSLTFDQQQFEQEYCMALNIYYETRGSSLADSFAVADVVLNRVEDTRYPDTVCDVVYQGVKHADGLMKRNACQFSWYCDGKADNPQNQEIWKRAQSIAWAILKWDQFRGISEGATHYHAHYVNPVWNRSKKGFSITNLGRIGAHIYYRWN